MVEQQCEATTQSLLYNGGSALDDDDDDDELLGVKKVLRVLSKYYFCFNHQGLIVMSCVLPR